MIDHGPRLPSQVEEGKMSKETLCQRRERRASRYGLHSLLATSTRCSPGSVYAMLMLNGETLLSLLFRYLVQL